MRTTVNVGRGEHGTVVTHRVNVVKREAEQYPQGVTWEMSPLFDFSKQPWMLLNSLTRQLVVCDLLVRHMKLDTVTRQITLLDAAAGFGEQKTLLDSRRKLSHVRYVGVELDRDKIAIAKQLRPSIDIRCMNVLDVHTLSDIPFDCAISSETLEHLTDTDGLLFLQRLADSVCSEGILVLTWATPLVHRRNECHLNECTLEQGLAMLPDNLHVLDKFHLAVNRRHWPMKGYGRVPSLLASPTMSSLCEHAGSQAVVVCRKV